MNTNIDLLRLACLIQDTDNQDFKRVIISLICEILYENNNVEIASNELFGILITKSKEPIDRDFFDSIIEKSGYFDITNSNDDHFIKLTHKKFIAVESSISEFSIEPSISHFLQLKGYSADTRQIIIKILYQSIYENIYSFNPTDISTFIPDIVKEKFSQKQLNIFNEFLEFDDPNKNKRLYNQFVKAIEFAILTSGRGVREFSSLLYKDKCYLLDTNIIFRMLGMGGEERQKTIIKLIKACINQGVKFEYTSNTFAELNSSLDLIVNKLEIAEKSRKIEIIQSLIEDSPHFFNDDSITHYCALKSLKKVSNPTQFRLHLKASFKTIVSDLGLTEANHNIRIENNEILALSNKLRTSRKLLVSSYSYSIKQAKVDAYNVLYVQKNRGANNYNYSDVKSFYLTTDRGLNKILSEDTSRLIPPTILPSQLFAIHNPLSSTDTTLDYQEFFSFIKRRTSEFKHRGRDVFSYIEQARVFTTDPLEIKNLVLAFSDERYNAAKTDSFDGRVIDRFKDFARTYFDEKLIELDDTTRRLEDLENNGEIEKYENIKWSKNSAKIIDILIATILIPSTSLFIGLINAWYGIAAFIIFELIKYILSKKSNLQYNLWIFLYHYRMERSAYYKLTRNDIFIKQGREEIKSLHGNYWQ